MLLIALLLPAGQLAALDPQRAVGLAAAKRIIELHGGQIWAESDGLGKGSTFCFTLPRPGGSGREEPE